MPSCPHGLENWDPRHWAMCDQVDEILPNRQKDMNVHWEFMGRKSAVADSELNAVGFATILSSFVLTYADSTKRVAISDRFLLFLWTTIL